MTKRKQFPVVPDDLLKALEEAFPDVALRGDKSLHDYAAHSGAQRVMDFLRKHHANQNQNILKG